MATKVPPTVTPYIGLVDALAASSSSQGGQNMLSAIGAQAGAFPASAAVSASVLPSVPLALTPTTAAAARDDFRPTPASALVPVPARSPIPAQSVAVQALLNGAQGDLREVRYDTRTRVNRAFYASLVLGVLGGLTLFTGIGLAFANAVPIGITSGIGGMVSGIFSGVFWQLYRAESDELRRLVGDLRRIEDARVGLWLADQIQDADQRDAAVRELIVQATRAASREEHRLPRQ